MDQVLEKFSFYQKKYRLISRAHHLTASHYARYNSYLGIPVVVLTTIISTAIFASLENNPDNLYKIAVGMISLLAAVLSALQTFLGYSEKTAIYKNAGIQYSIIKRQFDTLHLKYSSSESTETEQALEELTTLLDQVDKLAVEMPSVPDKFYSQAEQEYADETQ